MKKFFRILSIVAALTMLLSTLLVAAPAAPVAADDEAWSAFDLPAQGADGDYFIDENIEWQWALEQAADGTLYEYVGFDGDGDGIYKSDDGGRTWSETDYTDDVGGGEVNDIFCAPWDPDIVYAVDDAHVYKTEDGGDKWVEVGNATIGVISGYGEIWSVSAGEYDGDTYVYIATNTWGGYASGVFYKEDFTFGQGWTNMNLDDGDGGTAYDVYTLNCSPAFEDDATVYALISDSDSTHVVSNEGNDVVGDWDMVAELKMDDTDPFDTRESSNLCFVADFADEFEMFVGVAEAAWAGNGDVFRVDDGEAYDLGVDADITSLDVVGDYGDTAMIAASWGYPGSIFYSTDDGESWDETDKAPISGDVWSEGVVALADDFSSSGEAWCALYVEGYESSVAHTTDFGASWNAISMIDSDMDELLDFAFTPEYTSDEGSMFLVVYPESSGNSSVYEYDNTNWERIWYDAENVIHTVAVSPGYDSDSTLFIVDNDEPVILRSTDGGATFDALPREPADPISALIVIDDETILAGAEDGTIYKTVNHGRRAWDDITDVEDYITSFAMSPDFASDSTLILGTDNSTVFISTDAGDSWDEVSGSDMQDMVDGTDYTFVAFDPYYSDNMMIYAASNDIIARCEVDPEADPGDLEFANFCDDAEFDPEDGLYWASGIAVSDDGSGLSTLYVLDGDVGVWRALDPFQDMADITFELVNEGAEDVEFYPMVWEISSMELTYGSNIIWAIDSYNGDTIYSYTDNLAKAVTLKSPADKAKLETTNNPTFEWNSLADTVDNYQIAIDTESDFSADDPLDWYDVDDNTKQTAINLGIRDYIDSGTTYYWKVKVTEPYLSRVSVARSFTTKVGAPPEPVRLSPVTGADEVILSPTFGWGDITGASVYKIVVATDPAFANVIATGDSAIPAWTLPADVKLEYGTTYYWKVWGEAANGAPAGDEINSIFTTMDEPAAPQPPVTVTQAAPQPPPTITLTLPESKTPAYVWAVIAVGGVLVIALIVLIARTRKVV